MTRSPALPLLLCCALVCGGLAACADETPDEPPARTAGGAAPTTGARPGAESVIEAPSDASAPAGDDPAADEPGARAAALIRKMIEAYRDAPVLIETSTLSTTIGGRPQPDSEKTLRFGPGNDLAFDTQFFRYVHLDGTILITYFDVPDRYLRLEGVDDLYERADDELANVAGRLPQTQLRYGRPVDDIVRAFALGLTGDPRVSGFREITDLEGRSLHQISLATASGSATINVDPETNLLHSIETVEELADSPVPNLEVRRRTVFETKVSPSAPPIAFEPGDRVAVDSAEVLRGVGGVATVRALKLAPGEPAPDFVLYTILGERWTLSEHPGSIKVFVFWAHWDARSRNAIRQLTAIGPWSRETLGVQVDVIGVCGMRRQATEEDYWQKTVDFWERETPDFVTLIDPKDTLFDAWGVLGVPTILVLDGEGRFVNAIGGFEEGALETVAQIVEGVAQATSGER